MNIQKCEGQSDFNIATACTMVCSDAVVSVGTTFLDIPVTSTNEASETTYELDFSRIGSGRWNVSYFGILGY